MKSGFLSDVIDTEAVKVRIIGRIPEQPIGNESGLINIQVETESSWLVSCEDYIIVLRGTGLSGLNEKGKVYSYAVTDTSKINNCLSVSSIVVPKGYLGSWFDIEVYETGFSKEEIEVGSKVETTFFLNIPSTSVTPINPIAVIKEQLLWDLPIQEAKKGGLSSVIDALPGSDSITNPINAISGFMKTSLFVGIFGLGLYFAYPFIPGIRNSIAKKAKRK